MAMKTIASLIVTGVIIQCLTNEITAWSARLSEWLIRLALTRLPDNTRARYDEEWHSDLSQIPGEFSKALYALGFLRAARKLTSFAQNSSLGTLDEIVRRAGEICLGVLLMVTILPLSMAIGLLIKFSSPGPVLVKTRVIGKRGKAFDLFQFRTYKRSTSGETLLMTRLGRFLRRYSLDELPQFLNLIRGELALVGPRARRLQQKSKNEAKSTNIEHLKPGITGLWQITGGLQNQTSLDRLYAEQRSLLLDLKILWKTIFFFIKQ
ncbi:MAG: sugar transferase [Acidobacteriaceae bacterium]|nr:sugar transferase [Acidobacteriaceae bacterium]